MSGSKKYDDDKNSVLKNDGFIDIELLMDVLGNDVDRKIITKLSKVPRYASDLAKDIGISKPAIKKHIDKLIQIGILTKYDKAFENDKKTQYFCLNHNLSLSLNIDLSSNYFKYKVENTLICSKLLFNNVMAIERNRMALQVSVLGDKTLKDETGKYYRELAEKSAKNEALLQLGKALGDIEGKIRNVEQERNKFLSEKHDIINRIKSVLESLVSEPVERELIFSFLYHIFESMGKGVSIQRFLEDIFLKFKGSRSGIDFDKTTPQFMEKQMVRIKQMEVMLVRVIHDFSFVKIVKDRKTGEDLIIFNLER